MPELTVSSIPTLDVEEKERVDLSNVGDIESSRETLVETLNKGEALVVEREPEIREVSEPFKGSTTSEVNEDDKKYLDYERNVLEIPKNVKYEELDLNNDYKNSDKIIEVENSFTGDVFEDLALEEPTTVEDSLQVFLDSVEPCRLNLRDIYFGYLGVVAPKEVKRTEVIEDSKFKGVVESSKVASVVETVGVDDISAPRSTVAPIVDTTVDRLVRRDGEDIVMYARRLVRVSEVEVLRYFSPRELEIALERGNLLRKRGVIIFAHA